MSNIKEEMLKFRAKYNLSQTKCAKMAGITVQTWNQVELGQQSPSRLTEAKIMQIMADTEMKGEA